jgi:hypothetical protein
MVTYAKRAIYAQPTMRAAMANPRPRSPVDLIWLRAMSPKMTPVTPIKNDETNAAMARALVLTDADLSPRCGSYSTV